MTACAKKTVFLTKGTAKAAGRRAAPRLYFYECPHCGNYHLTKMRPETFARREHAREIIDRSPYVKW